MTQVQDPFKDFEPIVNPKDIENFLWEAGKTLAPAFLWVPSEPELSHRSHCLNVEVDPKRMTFWVPSDFDTKPWINYWATQSERFALFNLSLSRATLFFRAKYLGHDATGLLFEIPPKVYKVQRRKDARVTIPDGYTVRVEFPNPPGAAPRIASRKIIDISAGGLAFAVDEGEQAAYPSGTLLSDMRFTLKGREFKIDGEVRHNHTLTRDSRAPGYKIGVLFKDIKAGDSQSIASYVFEESRKIFAKIIG